VILLLGGSLLIRIASCVVVGVLVGVGSWHVGMIEHGLMCIMVGVFLTECSLFCSWFLVRVQGSLC
jgi:hypothetical protein